VGDLREGPLREREEDEPKWQTAEMLTCVYQPTGENLSEMVASNPALVPPSSRVVNTQPRVSPPDHKQKQVKLTHTHSPIYFSTISIPKLSLFIYIV
jgi:hypothetical protein